MSQWIDVTQTLRPGMIHWPGDRGFQLQIVERWSGPGTCNLSEIHTNAHVGTHIDAPRHLVEDGLGVADLPLSILCGPASVVDCRADRHVTASNLQAANIPSGDRVLLRTTNGQLWEKPSFHAEFIAIVEDAACWLVEHGTPLVGIDYLSIEPHPAPGQPVHRALLEAGVVVIEGLKLDGVLPGRYELVALPLKIEGGDGSPARVIVRPMESHA